MRLYLKILLCFVHLSRFFHCIADRSVQQQHYNKVCAAVDKVKGYACNPPVEHHGKTADEEIRYRAERTEAQPEYTRYYTVKYNGILTAYKPGYKCQQRPCVDIHYPPYTKTVYAALDKNKCRDDKKHLSAQYQCEHHNPEGCCLHIRNTLQGNFAHFDNCNCHTDKGYVTGCKFFCFRQDKSPLSYCIHKLEYVPVIYHLLGSAVHSVFTVNCN